MQLTNTLRICNYAISTLRNICDTFFRRKLAFASQTDTKKSAHNDLEVCFINEIVDEEAVEPETVLPRSKSECVSLTKKQGEDQEETNYTTIVYKLARCKQDAKRKMIVEKRNRKFHELNR